MKKVEEKKLKRKILLHSEQHITWGEAKNTHAGIYKYQGKYYYVRYDGSYECFEIDADDVKRLAVEKAIDFKTARRIARLFGLTLTEEEYSRLKNEVCANP